ncbi:DNA/RNA helicase, superfamily II [Sphaerochaeta pleomorpha str. Grapes]|uniref:DEAD-box ATP-dependent RNA helicase RhpA n=1 Tax=Sphaerochaeta pleomorpha (strain ATCC BAA-1885 / DSM 22778 / Grapes) TaxID=158190 RepID=G8QS36_SPHPG|nr:DEAD/DEAH box helicase [Sphaerochaeta pleomorpha]AEV28897.1 DNA/RNA helicase, superfamily II [Sphaerochaeta pleomorpha str. Grapes]
MPDLTHFAELGLSAQTIAALEAKGFEEPTKIQAACIPLLLKDQVDVIGQAQTGTGKTAAFGLPILEIVDPNAYQVQALILAPTRELAVQNAEEINSLKGNRRLEIAAVYGGASMDLQLRKLRRGVHVVVGTPGRILDHLRRGSLNLEHLKFVVLDEADEMLDMGFVDDIEEVLKQTPVEKRMLCFSATMPAPIKRLAEKFMRNPEFVQIQQDINTSNLTDQIYFEVREGDKFEALTRIIDMEEDFYGLIFCRTKVQCDEIGQKLNARGYDAEPLHGDLSQKQRELILQKMKNRTISIVVATDVAARGIDISDLTHVINYSLPEDPESYIHRVGRTGRAGKKGVAITFVGPREFNRFAFIKKVSKNDIRRESVPEASEIIGIKRARILSKLTEILAEEHDPNDTFLPLAQQLLEDNTPEQVVLTLLNHFYKDELDEAKYKNIGQGGGDREQRRDSRYSEEAGFTRLFIARGRKDGLDKRRLIDYLIEQVGARDQDLQDVSVRDDFSFVSAPLQVAERILQTFSDRSSEGRPLITRAKPDNPNGKNLSGRTRYDDRPARSGRGGYEDRPRGGGGRRSRDDYQPYGRDTHGGEDERSRSDEGSERPYRSEGSSRPHGMYSGSGKGKAFPKSRSNSNGKKW